MRTILIAVALTLIVGGMSVPPASGSPDEAVFGAGTYVVDGSAVLVTAEASGNAGTMTFRRPYTVGRDFNLVATVSSLEIAGDTATVEA